MSDREIHAVTVEIVEIMGSGACPVGLEAGDRWVLDSGAVPEGMCGWAYNSLAPFVQTLRFGGHFPWEEEPGEARACCPDPANPVVFLLRAEE